MRQNTTGVHNLQYPMAESTEQAEQQGWGAFLLRAIRASVYSGAERESIWSVSRPLIRLYLLLFTIQSGWLFWEIFRKTTAEHPSSGWESAALATLSGVSSHGLGVAMSSLIVVEGVSTLMVMYNLGMNLIVRPIIKWHERRGEARGEERGIAIGEARNDAEWRAWYQRSVDAAERGEPFDEPPPSPPHQNGAQRPEDRAFIAFFVPYCATHPPSMTSSLPVTNDASSDARYSTPYATSMASP